MIYGDILEYPRPAPGEDLIWRFMYLGTEWRRPLAFNQVLVLAIDPEDDLWIPGETIMVAGINEMVLADD